MMSKVSRFFQMAANFPDDFKTVLIFQLTANFPEMSKLSGFLQMTANFLDDVKSVRIFPDADNDYAFVGNVVRGKSALFRLVVRNTFVHFVWKVF